MDSKQLNIRIGKWREMLKNDLFHDPQLLKSRLRKGIPPSLRILVWPKLIQIERLKAEEGWVYDSLLTQKSLNEQEIKLDIPRTTTEDQPQIMHKSLYNVLKALSIVFPGVGYCQGMNLLVMRFLQTVDDETAFWIMVCLIKRHKNLFQNLQNPRYAQRQNYVLDMLLKKHVFDVYDRVRVKQSISLISFTPRWFVTMFSCCLPRQAFYRMMDCFLYEGYKIAYRASLALIKYNETKLLANDVEANIGLLTSDQRIAQKLDPCHFVDLLFEFSLKREQLSAYEQKFVAENDKLIKKLQHESEIMYERRQMDFKLRCEGIGEENSVVPLHESRIQDKRSHKPKFQC